MNIPMNVKHVDNPKTLQVNTITVHEVDYQEFERFAKELYGQDLEVVSAEEWNNDEEHSYDIKKGGGFPGDKETMQNFKESGEQSFGITYAILQDMVDNDFIPAGTYLIGICW